MRLTITASLRFTLDNLQFAVAELSSLILASAGHSADADCLSIIQSVSWYQHFNTSASCRCSLRFHQMSSVSGGRKPESSHEEASTIAQ